MEKLNFSIEIKAPKQKVWKVLFDDATYRNWASVFAQDTYAETDWKEGSKALFLDGKGNGMISRIAKNEPNRFLSIEHLGMIKDGVEDFESEDIKRWAGAKENYTLAESGGTTSLKVDMDSDSEWKDYFSETWPKALEKVKELSENN